MHRCDVSLFLPALARRAHAHAHARSWTSGWRAPWSSRRADDLVARAGKGVIRMFMRARWRGRYRRMNRSWAGACCDNRQMEGEGKLSRAEEGARKRAGTDVVRRAYLCLLLHFYVRAGFCAINYLNANNDGCSCLPVYDISTHIHTHLLLGPMLAASESSRRSSTCRLFSYLASWNTPVSRRPHKQTQQHPVSHFMPHHCRVLSSQRPRALLSAHASCCALLSIGWGAVGETTQKKGCLSLLFPSAA